MKRRFRDGKVTSIFRRRRNRNYEAEFNAMVARLRWERQTAGTIVDRLLRTTPRSEWPALSEHSDLRTAGALEHLGNTFAAMLTRDPREAMAIAELAVAAAEGVPRDAYTAVVAAQLRAHAWKDLGKAMRFLARNEEALEAFDKAAEAIETYGVLEHDRAIVRFNRAISLQELERFEESRVLLAECKQLFDEFGDSRNLVLCGLAEGILLQRLRRYREARESYLLLFVSANEMDTETRAALHRAIGLCSIELGDLREAEQNLAHAIAMSEALGQRMESAKSQRCLGVLFIRRGDVERGIAYLRSVRREFLRHGLSEEAGLCGLDVVEGMLIAGRTSAAETLARKIVGEFTAASLNRRAIVALGYLTEAITANRASAALVTEVRDYIVSLRTSPERDFVATS